MRAHLLEEQVEAWFLEAYGDGAIMETVHDPGNGLLDRIAENDPAGHDMDRRACPEAQIEIG